jgi:hypothetical protein
MMPLLPATLALALGASPAGKIALIDLDTPPTMIGMGSQVGRSLQVAAAKEKLAVLTADELLARLGLKKYEELVKCGGKVACVAQGLSEVPEVTHAISGVLSLDEKNYHLRLSLIDVKKTELVTDVDRSILIASRRFQKDVEQLAGPLLRGEREARGTLVVQTNVRNAQVTVNGEFLGVAPVTLKLKPGKHEVRVERPKYLPVHRLVDLEADQTFTEEIRMILKPGEQPDDEQVPALAGKNVPTESTQGFRITAPTVVAGGAAIAAFGVGVVFGLQVSAGEKRLLSGYDKANETYTGSRADALGVRSNATIANIAFGVGAAAVVVAGVLLILDIRAANAPVEVAPAVGPAGASVLIGGHF